MSRAKNLIEALTLTPAAAHRLTTLDLGRVRRLHFVCKGNVCRSAYAEARARQLGIVSSSSGVEAGQDKPADAVASRTALVHGVTLEQHATAPFDDVVLAPGDLIVAMEPWQARSVMRRAIAAGAQVTLLGLWNRPGHALVRDPYGLSDDVFHRTFEDIDRSLACLRSALAGAGSPSIGNPASEVPPHLLDPLSWKTAVPNGVRYWAKCLLGWLLYFTGAYRAIVRDRALVVVFHSVIPAGSGDSLRISLPVFRRYLVFFRRYFDVVSLSELVRKLEAGESVSRNLAVTFDDGYADNAQLAAPVLAQQEIPATFYLTTAFIGSDLQAPWDLRKQIRSRWMSWQDVKDLVRAGHDLGIHTETHPEVAELDDAQLEQELRGSVQTISDRAGIRPVHFALPFGRPSSLTPQVISQCRTLGVRSIASAVGGAVVASDPLLGINRFPVNPIEAPSPYAGGVDILTDCRTVTRRRIFAAAS